jgi:signal transduction histidine kinase
MQSEKLFRRFLDLQRYVGWTAHDAERIATAKPLLSPDLPRIIDDFYGELQQHPDASAVITGGQEQVERLKRTLLNWLNELLSGRYDEEYVVRRWLVGRRHVEIGLAQVYTNAAMSRLRMGLLQALEAHAAAIDLAATQQALIRLTDLDLAIIEDAYQAEYVQRMQRIERLATIGQVAGGIAHELRNPLNVIRTSVYYLRTTQKLTPEKLAQHLERIEKQVGLGDSVITALSNFARMPMPDITAIPLAEFFRNLLDRSPVPERIDVRLELPDVLPPASADRNQLEIVFGNLVRNACDAMPDGGRLTIAATADLEGLTVVIQDTGHGIPVEHQKRIMEPFFSTKARGIGLGLALSRAILERNSGRISVESAPGQGAAFTVKLPAARSGT